MVDGLLVNDCNPEKQFVLFSQPWVLQTCDWGQCSVALGTEPEVLRCSADQSMLHPTFVFNAMENAQIFSNQVWLVVGRTDVAAPCWYLHCVSDFHVFPIFVMRKASSAQPLRSCNLAHESFKAISAKVTKVVMQFASMACTQLVGKIAAAHFWPIVGFDWLRMVDARLGKKIRKYEDRANQFLVLTMPMLGLSVCQLEWDVMGAKKG